MGVTFNGVLSDIEKRLNMEDYKGVCLHGPKSRGAHQRLMNRFKDRFNFVDLNQARLKQKLMLRNLIKRQLSKKKI